MNEEIKNKKLEEELEQREQINPEDEEPVVAEQDESIQESYEEPSWEEQHEDVPDVVDGGEQENVEGVEEELNENGLVDEEPEALEENEVQPQEKMLTQSQVNELVGRARQEGRMSAIKELLERYGVGDENELNDVFGRGQAYDSLNDEFTNTNHLYGEVMAENALLKTQVDFNRWEDVKLILGGKGLEVTEENIQALLPSHPEWKAIAAQPQIQEGGLAANSESPQQPSVLQKLGEDTSPKVDEMSEEEQVRKWYGI